MNEELIDEDLINEVLVRQLNDYTLGRFKDRRLLKDFPEELGKRVIGQKEAVSCMINAVLRAEYGLARSGRPLGVYLFAGPTGVGKTELAKAVADTAFDGNLIRIDMSEYSTRWSASRLLGSNPGYVGFGDTRTLVDMVNEKPKSIILLDEIEKAYPTIYDLFLQVFDDGRLTAGAGNTGDFTRSLIIMTSNLGFTGSSAKRIRVSGFGADESFDDVVEARVRDAVSSFFRPEFLNRMDGQVIFRSLKPDEIRRITEIGIKEKLECLSSSDIGVNVTIEPEVIGFIAEKYYNEANGARPISRGIEREIGDRLVEGLRNRDFQRLDSVTFAVRDGELILDVESAFEPDDEAEQLDVLF